MLCLCDSHPTTRLHAVGGVEAYFVAFIAHHRINASGINGLSNESNANQISVDAVVLSAIIP